MNEVLGIIPEAVLRYLIAAVALAGIALLAQVFIWIRAKVALLRGKMEEEDWNMLYNMIVVLVRAAEQLGLKDRVLKDGAEKKKWVLARLQEALRRLGWEIDKASFDYLCDLIEGIVFEEFNRYERDHPGFTNLVPNVEPPKEPPEVRERVVSPGELLTGVALEELGWPGHRADEHKSVLISKN